ncbi:tripartite motif-containing protein 2-like [Ptychodera flava]|uniref:tripartite motif-containing protein 2-like n=1 Tax=Ptychodera flava TaxID=63121 RepID=UPI00396A2D5C
MASSNEESQSLETTTDNFLTCTVCTKIFRNAKILPCVHTFCEQCLRKIVEENGELTCPICRRSHELPAGGVAELSADLFVSQLVEEFDNQDEKKGSRRKCEACEIGNVLIDHPRPEHKFRYVDDAVAQYKQLLTKMTQELQIKENGVGESKAAVQQMTESVNSRFQEEIKKVKDHMEKTIEDTTNKIRENGDNLLQQLKIEHEERKGNLKAQLKDLECTGNDIAATRDYADKLIQYGNASQLMSAKKSMTSQIRELLKVTTKCEPVVDDYVEFQSTDNFCETESLGVLKIIEERYELSGLPEYSRLDEQITLTLQLTGSRRSATKVTWDRSTALTKTPGDKSENVTVTDNYDGTFSLTYCAKAEGEHELSASVDGQAVQGSPVTVVVGPKKDCGNKQVVVCDENGKPVKCFGKDHLKGVLGITISPYNGNVYVVDGDARCIRIYSQSGDYIECFGSYGNRVGQFSQPWDITVESSEGKVFVSDNGSHSVKVFDADGGFLFSFGSRGSADGQFTYPWGICNDQQGCVYVCDYSNNRVQKFSSSGAFICQVDCGTEALQGPVGVCVTGEVPFQTIIIVEQSAKRIKVVAL